MPDLYLTKAPIFHQLFRFRASQGLPGTQSLPSEWGIVSGAFTTTEEAYLRATQPGELLYIGTSLHDLKWNETDNANFGIAISTLAIEDLKFELRGRRSDAENFISLVVDFESGTFAIKQTEAGTATTLESQDHIWKFNEPLKYAIELWMFDNRLEGWVNGSPFISVNSSFNITEDGFSIFVPEVWTDQPTIFYEIYIHETNEYPDPQLSSSDLIVIFRENLQNKVNNPIINDFENFKETRTLYEHGKDLGRSDDTWAKLGYPLRRPMPEAWFGST